MALFPVLERQRQADLSEFETSLVYKAVSRRARTVTQRNPVLKNKNKNKKRAHTDFAEDPSSVPIIHVSLLTAASNLSTLGESNALFSLSFF